MASCGVHSLVIGLPCQFKPSVYNLLMLAHCKIVTLALSLITLIPLPARAENGGKVSMPSYETRYYTIYTDLPPQRVREAELRTNKMVELYQERTKDFSGSIHQRLPFYLFTKEQDYLDAGGIEGSSGVFDNSSQVLMAVAVEKSSETWYTVQHEGFHQFAHAVIGGELPVWVNEGLAEYFGESIFTGEGYVPGIIPDWRLRRIKMNFTANRFRPIEEMMNLAHRDWNDELSVVNYDQAWSMVHFLAHAENGKYQSAFIGFMRDVGNHQPADKSWENNFGSAEGFELKWKAYWQAMKPGSTTDAYARATLQTLAAALGRAQAKKLHYDSLEAMEKAITTGAIKFEDQQYLPTSVLEVALENLTQLRKSGHHFKITTTPGRQPIVIADLTNGTRWTAQYTLQNNKVAQVAVTKSPSSTASLAPKSPTTTPSIQARPQRP
jgi:hypothetical protein